MLKLLLSRLPELWISLCLIALAREDLKRKSIPVILVLVLFGSGLLFRLCCPSQQIICYTAGSGTWSLPQSLLAMLPGGILLLFSVLSRGGIGAGDGLTLAALGIWLSPLQIGCLVWGGLICALIVAIVLLIRKHPWTAVFPFLPMLCISWLFGLLAGFGVI